MAEQVFVARERELSQLQSFLDRGLAGLSATACLRAARRQAQAGHGQVCFVTGEAGAGKTALVTEFARRAQAQHDELLVAIGDCNAQTGIGDPYLPFREILGLLTGDVEREVALGRPSSGSGQVERHPLEKVVAEFKRYHGSVWVNLAEVQVLEGRPFVDALLDTERNRLDDDFRQALFAHTAGHRQPAPDRPAPLLCLGQARGARHRQPV